VVSGTTVQFRKRHVRSRSLGYVVLEGRQSEED